MTTKKKITIVILIAMIFVYKNYIPSSKLAGVYILNYTELAEGLAEAPNYIDTLVIMPDSTYKSNYYGAGGYKFDNSFAHHVIQIGSNELPVNKTFLGDIRIIISYDRDLYYQKIQ